jgi:beta-lactamase class D
MRFLLAFLCAVGATRFASAQQVVQRDYRSYFEAHQVEGSFLLLDAAANQYTAYNLTRCRQGFLPASTFKIPNTLIGLETGALRDTSDLCRWDGRPRARAEWNQDMTYAQALRRSCVPCYQQLARRLGVSQYQKWLPRLRFGHPVVSPATLDSFWLTGPSRITSFEEVAFLQRLQANQLPLTARSQELTKALLVLKRGPGWVLRAKGGWSSAPGYNNGWWVGWVEKTGRAYFFALNMASRAHSPAGPTFARDRQLIAEQILRERFQLLP